MPTRLPCGSPDFNMKIVANDNNYDKAGAELGQAQLKLGLDFIVQLGLDFKLNTKICLDTTI